MDFQLSEDQDALVAALQDILQDHGEVPQSEKFGFAWHDASLQAMLRDNGFLDAVRDIGPLEAALVVYECARGPAALDTIGRGLVAPLVAPTRAFDGPVALATEAGLDKAIRNLTIADTLLVDCGDDVVILPVDPAGVEPVTSIYAFPYGRFTDRVSLASGERLRGAGPLLRQWWRVGLAAEIAGASAAAIDFTVDHVKQRQVFGRPVGSFQSVQHRIVHRYANAKSGYYLAMKAAWSAQGVDADVAACHAQHSSQALVMELHQFNGGMGVTTEHLLHFWTYRVRALQSEVGGVHVAARAIADQRWPDATADVARKVASR